MDQITPAELSGRLGSDDGPFVLDVRPEDEYEDWHVPGSENVDVYDALRDDPETAREALAEVPHERQVVVVCAAGVVAETAAELLVEVGYEVRTLACNRP